MTMTQGKFLLSFEKSASGKEKDKLEISNNRNRTIVLQRLCLYE